MTAPRIVITGAGWVTPLGHDVESTWDSLLRGRSGVGRITRFDAETFRTNFAAEVRGFDLSAHIDGAPRHSEAGLNAQFALAAAAQACRQAGIDAARPDPRRFGVYMASGEGTLDFEHYTSTHIAAWDQGARALDHAEWARQAQARMSPVAEIEQEANLTLSHIAWAFDCRGPAVNCLTACAASIQAIGEATEMLRRGDADVMLAGGSHSMIHPLGITGFIRLTAMSARRDDPAAAARPFDQTRDGFVMGEGAGVLVLETEDHARARGARPLAEVAGYGSSADAFRVTDMHPDGKGPRDAMLAALRQARVWPREPLPDGRPAVQYIAVHGTGTKENDRIETKAVKQVFGPHAPRIPMSSVKSMMGHLIAAAGVSNAITAVKVIQTGLIPPTINYKNPDSELDLDYVPNTARDARPSGGVQACLCNSYGFGGQNDALLIRALA